MTARAARLRQGSSGRAQDAATASYHPWGTGATPLAIPSHALTYTPVQDYPWGTSGVAEYQEAQGMWAADGAWVAAVPHGAAGNVQPAGRP